jgi:predicted Zn-ribbon and HTH transcriptional regulator
LSSVAVATGVVVSSIGSILNGKKTGKVFDQQSEITSASNKMAVVLVAEPDACDPTRQTA